jgi:pilus assembly protein CpaF
MPTRFFIFTGAKGGTGVSTTVAHLSRSMKELQHTVVVDADLSARRSAGILFEAVNDLDVAHEQTGGIPVVRIGGVTLLELTQTYESAFTLNAADVDGAVASLDAGVALVDAPLPFSAVVRPIVARAQRFFVVTEPTILGITAARKMIAQFERFGVPAERVAAVVCMRLSSPVGRAEVERALDVPIVAELPPMDDRGYARALAALQYAVLSTPESPALVTLGASDNGEVRDRRSVRRMASIGEVSTNGKVSSNGKASPVQPDPAGDREALKAAIHRALAENLNLFDASKVQGDAKKLAQLRQRIADIAQTVIMNAGTAESAESIAQLKEEIVNETLGLGPLEELMADPDVTEIMVNGPNQIYVERFGSIEETTKRFTSAAQLRLVIERIIAPLGRRVDEAVPMVDARLADGSRVNAIIAPLSLNGPTVTIRRFGTRRLTGEDLLAKHSANREVLEFLSACVQARLNIIISGGTGSGKTTLLNILSSFLPEKERIVTIEDAAELLLNQRHVVSLESRPPNIEGTGQITIRDLVRNALRMRPDRIVVGECRGPEALDMLQAMNTGHDGSLTTIHANTARDALSRVETMVLMAGFDLPVRAIREQVSSAINVVVQTSRLRDGSRKIVGVSEIAGMEGDVITMQEIVHFAQHGVDEDGRVRGDFQYTGVQPLALKRFEEYGVPFDRRTFSSLPLAASVW